MTAGEIFNFLCEIAPLELALDFDNPGFLIGDKLSKVKKAVICLDCTTDSIEFAKSTGAELIITHHPIIFSPLKQVTVQDDGKRAYNCIKNDISVISMHTNLDSADGGVNDCLAEKIGLSDIHKLVCDDGFSFRIGNLEKAVSALEFADILKQKLGGVIKYTEGNNKIKCVAVCGGSGSGMADMAINAGADAFVTADVKHDNFIEALEKNFSLFDAGHYDTEKTIIEPLKNRLQKSFGHVEFYSYELKLFSK